MGAVTAMCIPEIVSAALATENVKKQNLHPNDVVLFQGDSITDWGRDKSNNTPNTSSSLGSGYVLATASGLLREYAGLNLQVYNKGISGNKVFQLIDRWDADTLAIKPNVLSIMVGVNDYWHTVTSGYKGTIETYKNDYIKLLTLTKQALPNVRLIIGEPFAIKGVKAVDDSWYPAFDLYRQAARDVAGQFGASFIPYQAIFDKAQEQAPAAYWSIDGVHPTVAGTGLMADAWQKVVKGW